MTPAPLRAMIADDEPPARRWLRELLAAHPTIQVVAEAGSVPSAIETANRVNPDVLFLDIQMPPRTGFDILPALPAGARIVFVTAHDTFAIRAFDANALDYLLKPVSPARLARTVQRLTAPSPEVSARAAERGALGPQDLVALRDGGLLRMAAVGDIAAIQAEGAYTRVLLADAPSMLVLRPIGEWEQTLPSPPFTRIDRSLLVNLPRIRALDVRSRDESRLEIDSPSEPLLLGRTASQRIRKLLAGKPLPLENPHPSPEEP